MGQLLFYEMHLRDQEILPPLDLKEDEKNRFMDKKNVCFNIFIGNL